MSEIKVRLSLVVPGATLLSSQECDKTPKESYNEHKMLITSKKKGKQQKGVKELLIINTRKQKLIHQNISICEEAYHHMLDTPTSRKLSKLTKANRLERVWDTLTIHERLKYHFDLIAHDLNAVSYSYEILND